MAKSASKKAAHTRPRKTPERDPLTERFFDLNSEFGELIDGKASGPDDFITDPDFLARFTRPSEDEIRAAIKGKKRNPDT